MNASFRQKEDACERTFRSLRKIYHCVSPENFELIATNDKEYADIMLILGICSCLFTNLKILTYQIMSNHFHIVVCGDINEVKSFIETFSKRLGKYLLGNGRVLNINKLAFQFFEVDSLEYCRSTIAYCNRNGFVVHDDTTPFSYQWGANACYFSPLAKRYYSRCREQVYVALIRSIIHGKMADGVKTLYLIDGVVSPYSFCDISSGEKLFRDAKQYFYCISRNVESYRQIASIISESTIYTDDDLYLVVRQLSIDHFGEKTPSSLPVSAKAQLAKTLHFEYNASEKQIVRMLKLEPCMLAGIL